MIEGVTYNVPTARASEYPGQRLVVRSRVPAEIVACLTDEATARLDYIQILAPDADIDVLIPWGNGVPVDIVLQDPVAEYPHLYRFAPLRENHLVRVTVPVVAGFSSAVKLAVALHFAVKLEMVRPPDPDLIGELAAVLDLYLHRPTVLQPVEPFHSLLLAFYWKEPATLWAIQEEDPDHARYVTDDGGETISPRFSRVLIPTEIGAFVTEYQKALMAHRCECVGCEFWQSCGGYFQWPRAGYGCDGVRTLFRTLRDAACQLREDVEAAPAARGGTPR